MVPLSVSTILSLPVFLIFSTAMGENRLVNVLEPKKEEKPSEDTGGERIAYPQARLVINEDTERQIESTVSASREKRSFFSSW